MDILSLYRGTKDILRAATPDELIDADMPVIYDGIMKNWDSYPKWNIKYLVEKFGNCKISADRKINDHTEYISAGLSAYADYIHQTDEEVPYYCKSTLHLGNVMEKEYEVPAPFNCWYKDYYKLIHAPRKIALSCLYLGPRGARSTIHKDIWGTSFWNALYEGRKLWLFFPGDQDKLLYNGEVDPLAVDTARFPLYREAEPVVCIQEPGELIYCPGNIWHWAYLLEPGLALSENFINRENYLNVLAYFKSVGYNNAARKMEDIARIYLTMQ